LTLILTHPIDKGMKKNLLSIAYIVCLFGLLTSCESKHSLGSKEKPISFYMIPGQDARVLEVRSQVMKAFLEKETGLSFEIKVPLSYIAVIESFGSKRADMAIINPFGYILAREKYNVTARLRGIHYGRSTYNGQIIVRADKYKKLEELNNKKFAFVDPASTSGYLMPADLLKKKKINIKEAIFAGQHDSVVLMVYQGKVDAGATFYSPDNKGQPQDARKLVKTQYPDVFEKVKILTLTDSIPNDPIIFSAELQPELREKITTSLKKFANTPEGSQVLMDLYNMSNLSDTTDADYDSVREALLVMGKKAGEFIK